MLLEEENAAFVICHPAHLLTVAGMVIRLKPRILTLTKTNVGAGRRQNELIHAVLDLMGMSDLVTSLAIDEEETYRQLFAHDYEPIFRWQDRIRQWLDEVSPTVVFGDAYEASNIQHDMGSLFLDEALKASRAEGKEIARYEFPLMHQTAGIDNATVQYGFFEIGPYHEFQLNPEEIAFKKQAVEVSKRYDAQVEQLTPLFPSLETEIYRPVPLDRDYTRPPENHARYYDLHGQRQVEAGKYEKAILFEEHFVPLVEAVLARGQ